MTKINFDENNKRLWGNSINSKQLLYPNEHIVRFLAKNYSDKMNNSNLKALDLGFGTGRHMKLLRDYNFQTYGLDYSEDSYNVAKGIFGDDKNIHMRIGDLRKLSLESNFFDVILVYGMIYLRGYKEVVADLLEINRVLKKDAKMIINFRTKEDFLFKNGELVEENSFIINYGAYKGMYYTFFDLDEAKDILEETGFVIESTEREDYYKNNLQEQHSWWIFNVKKG